MGRRLPEVLAVRDPKTPRAFEVLPFILWVGVLTTLVALVYFLFRRLRSSATQADARRVSRDLEAGPDPVEDDIHLLWVVD